MNIETVMLIDITGLPLLTSADAERHSIRLTGEEARDLYEKLGRLLNPVDKQPIYPNNPLAPSQYPSAPGQYPGIFPPGTRSPFTPGPKIKYGNTDSIGNVPLGGSDPALT